MSFRFVIEEIIIGLQFPRKWLIPVYPGSEPVSGLALDDPLPEPYHRILAFNAGKLEYSSKDDFNFTKLNSFDLHRSMIGNTGLIAEFTGLKIDLQSDSNIPEATADGRPDNFREFMLPRPLLPYLTNGLLILIILIYN